MTIWDDQFENHRVRPALDQAMQALESGEQHLADAAQIEAHARLRHVLEYTRQALASADPELASMAALEAIATNLDSITTYMQQFATSPDQPHLDNANSHADAILVQLPGVSPLATTGDVEGLQAAAISFRRSVGQHTRNVDSELDAAGQKAAELDQRLTGQAEKVETQDARIDSVITEFQSQFSTEQTQRSAQFSEVLERSRTEASEAVEGLKTQIEEAMSGARSGAETALAEAKAAAEEHLTGLRTEAETRLNECPATSAPNGQAPQPPTRALSRRGKRSFQGVGGIGKYRFAMPRENLLYGQPCNFLRGPARTASASSLTSHSGGQRCKAALASEQNVARHEGRGCRRKGLVRRAQGRATLCTSEPVENPAVSLVRPKPWQTA
jgi:hypothetical protein